MLNVSFPGFPSSFTGNRPSSEDERPSSSQTPTASLPATSSTPVLPPTLSSAFAARQMPLHQITPNLISDNPGHIAEHSELHRELQARCAQLKIEQACLENTSPNEEESERQKTIIRKILGLEPSSLVTEDLLPIAKARIQTQIDELDQLQKKQSRETYGLAKRESSKKTLCRLPSPPPVARSQGDAPTLGTKSSFTTEPTTTITARATPTSSSSAPPMEVEEPGITSTLLRKRSACKEKEETKKTARMSDMSHQLNEMCTDGNRILADLPRTFTPTLKQNVSIFFDEYELFIQENLLEESQRKKIDTVLDNLVKKLFLQYLPSHTEEITSLVIKRLPPSVLYNACLGLTTLGSDNVRCLLHQLPCSPLEKKELLASLVSHGFDVGSLLQWQECEFLNGRDRVDLIRIYIQKFHELPWLLAHTDTKPAQEQLKILHDRLSSLGMNHFEYQYVVKKLYYPTISNSLLLLQAAESTMSLGFRQKLLDDIVQANPVFVYEHWDQVAPNEQERLVPQMPYFQIKEALEHLAIDPLLSIDKIRPVLQMLHEVNKTKGIPLSLYRPCPELLWKNSYPYSLDKIIERLASNCSEKESLLTIIHCLIDNYFVGTNWLISVLFTKAKELLPGIETFYTQHFEHPSLEQITSPFLTPEGAKQILISKLEQHQGLTDSLIDVFDFCQLEEKLRSFQTSESTRAFFLFYFRDPKHSHNPTPFHYSPLYVEKESTGELKTYNSDSLGKNIPGSYFFSEQIEQKLLKWKDLVSQIVVTEQRRQQDEYSCVVFAIKDLIEIMHIVDEENSSFFEFLEQSRSTNPLPQQLAAFPLSFLKVGQSLSQMERALSLPLGGKKVKVLTIPQPERDLKGYIDRYRYIAPLLPIGREYYKNWKPSKKAFLSYIPRNFNAPFRECKWFLKMATTLSIDTERNPAPIMDQREHTALAIATVSTSKLNPTEALFLPQARPKSTTLSDACLDIPPLPFDRDPDERKQIEPETQPQRAPVVLKTTRSSGEELPEIGLPHFIA